MSHPCGETFRAMRNRFTVMDKELEEKIKGLSPAQIRLMGEIFEGLASELSKTERQRRVECLVRINARN